VDREEKVSGSVFKSLTPGWDCVLPRHFVDMNRIMRMRGWLLVMLISVQSLSTGIAFSRQPGQQASISGQDLRNIPPDVARIMPFASKVRKNRQGFWEVELPFGIEMIYVPPGEFSMGSPSREFGREPDEGPFHRVHIKGIWIGKFEVTREIWHAVMGGGPAQPEKRNLPKGDVSYHDVQKFLLAIQMRSGLKFRLPTEAEWERCCRGGGQAPQYGPLDEIAWHVENSGGQPHPVGTKRPNDFGIYDMLGNVWEWCSDWHGAKYYAESPDSDPSGPAQGERRIVRGGGFGHGGHYLRSAHRNDQDPAKSKPHLGFRLVLDQVPTGD